jgi:hypothetical protein
MFSIKVTNEALEPFKADAKSWLDPQGRLLPSEKARRLEAYRTYASGKAKGAFLDKGWSADEIVEASAHLPFKDFAADVLEGGALGKD